MPRQASNTFPSRQADIYIEYAMRGLSDNTWAWLTNPVPVLETTQEDVALISPLLFRFYRLILDGA